MDLPPIAFSGDHLEMDDVMLATAAVGGVLGAAGALWNGVQIARLAGRVDALGSTMQAMQAVINALVSRDSMAS